MFEASMFSTDRDTFLSSSHIMGKTRRGDLSFFRAADRLDGGLRRGGTALTVTTWFEYDQGRCDESFEK